MDLRNTHRDNNNQETDVTYTWKFSLRTEFNVARES